VGEDAQAKGGESYYIGGTPFLAAYKYILSLAMEKVQV